MGVSPGEETEMAINTWKMRSAVRGNRSETDAPSLPPQEL